MTFTNAEDKPDGILIAMADKVLSRLDYGWEAHSYPAKRLAKSMANGQIDLWIGLSTLPEFEGTTYVSKTIVTKLFLNAYTIGNNPPIHSSADLFNKTIIILRGYSYGGWITIIKEPANRIDFIEVSDLDVHFVVSKKSQNAEKLLDQLENTYLVLKAKGEIPADSHGREESSFGGQCPHRSGNHAKNFDHSYRPGKGIDLQRKNSSLLLVPS